MMRRHWWSPRRLAGIAITAQFLALVRTLGGVFRIKYFLAQLLPKHFS